MSTAASNKQVVCSGMIALLNCTYLAILKTNEMYHSMRQDRQKELAKIVG